MATSSLFKDFVIRGEESANALFETLNGLSENTQERQRPNVETLTGPELAQWIKETVLRLF